MDFFFIPPPPPVDTPADAAPATGQPPIPAAQASKPVNKPIGMACRACRLRKIRCGGERPRCTYCIKKGYECVLTPHKKRGRPRKNTSEPADKVADLDVRQLWAELTGMQEFPAELTALTNDIDPGMSFMSPEFNLIPGDPLFAPSNYAFPFDSLPASATQPTFGFAADTPSAVSQDEAKHSDVRMSPGSSTQVSVGMAVDDGVRKYFQFVHPWIPLLHRPTFERQINDGSVDPLLYYAVQAIAARFADSNSGKKPWKRGARYARAARRLLPEALKRAQLSTLQAISILALYMSVSGQWQAGAALEKLAVQLAFAGQYHLLDEEFLLPPVTNNMGLFEAGWSEHSQPARLEVLSRPGGVLEHEQRRRAWWSIFVLERFNGLAMGRPPIIKPGWHWVWLPCAEDLWAREDPSGLLAWEMGMGGDESRPRESTSCRVDLVLALIMGQIIEQRTDMFRLFFPRVDKGTLFHDNLATHELDWSQRLSRLVEGVGGLEKRIAQWHAELDRYCDQFSARRHANLVIMGASCQIHLHACVLQIREHLFEDLLIGDSPPGGPASGAQTPCSDSGESLDLSGMFERHTGTPFDRATYQRGYMARAKRPPLTSRFIDDLDVLARRCWDRAVAMSDEIARLLRLHWLGDSTDHVMHQGVFAGADVEAQIMDRFKLMNPQTAYHLFVAGKVQAARLKQAVTARSGRKAEEGAEAVRKIYDIWDSHGMDVDRAAVERRLDDIIKALEYCQVIWYSLNFASHLKYLRAEALKPLLHGVYR
ncbi:hypothetical protein H4218_005050 [Coemansia sp. IMI 209128]|nr:hypothetical protein H4218_005050 [Coemansia sp. IMI 209128]